MATYDFSQDQLSDLIDGSGVFSSDDRDAIIQALQYVGVFSTGSESGADAHTVVVGPDDLPTVDPEVVVVTGAPDGHVNLDPANTAYIFDTIVAVDASLHGTGNHVLVTGGGNDHLVSTGSSSDFIFAGDGDNTVDAGSGNDTVVGGDGNDNFNSGSG